MISVNFEKAQSITKDRLRLERTPLLLEQDILFQRATEENASTEAIVAEKNRLRRITTLADTAKTLDTLKSLGCLSVEG